MKNKDINCCQKCFHDALQLDKSLWLKRMMILCPTCGNKRCPKATDHNNKCTNSNEPGQPGSSY